MNKLILALLLGVNMNMKLMSAQDDMLEFTESFDNTGDSLELASTGMFSQDGDDESAFSSTDSSSMELSSTGSQDDASSDNSDDSNGSDESDSLSDESGDDGSDDNSDDVSSDASSDDTSDDDTSVSSGSDDTSDEGTESEDEEDDCVELAESECAEADSDDGDQACGYNAITGECYSIERRNGEYGAGNFDDGFLAAQKDAQRMSGSMEAVVGVLAGIVGCLLMVIIGGAYYFYSRAHKQRAFTVEMMDIESPPGADGNMTQIQEDDVELIQTGHH